MEGRIMMNALGIPNTTDNNEKNTNYRGIAIRYD